MARLAPTGRQSGDLRLLHPIAPGVSLYRGFFSNSAVLVLPEGVVVVDTQVSPVAARRLRQAIERAYARPFAFVLNTHYHGDHSGGNAAFTEAPVIATDETARFVRERDGERRGVRAHLRPPVSGRCTAGATARSIVPFPACWCSTSAASELS